MQQGQFNLSYYFLKTKIGYEINLTKYFYKFKPLRSLSDIKTEILKLEETTVELEKKVFKR